MRIIVAKESDQTRYLDASTDELWAKSSLKLLTERLNLDYWYDKHDNGYPEIVRVVHNQDLSFRGKWPIAWLLLRERKDYEYEFVELENVEE